MKNGRSIAVVVAYIITMLLISLVAIATIRNTPKSPINKNEDVNEGMATETVYIPVYAEPESETKKEDPDTEEQKVYTVKSYEGRIGVFENGELSYLLDVYVNTLPKTDRRLLEEGVVAYSEEELRDIIEDYTA